MRIDQGSTDSIWHWLALGQHRGLPTRLLDWTYSPFVALHFATAHLAAHERGRRRLDDQLRRSQSIGPGRLKRMMTAEGSDTATVDMLGTFGSLRDFDRLSRTPFVVFLEPPSLDPRITNQLALFSLMSSASATLDDWLAKHARLARRVILPASLKWEVRDKLDQANVNERVLFPGLDGLSRWLTRYYWPKPVRRHDRSNTKRRTRTRGQETREIGL